eukprot:CAMPEP_0181059730 /NCGR_PEP_ID=MMETSP1070-20121207/21548_1 /TAXON_ID=265543 /ORGANISM="Minutocellus polymorphus, Strain NH13" /LENGTH=85 /DNA_ID=CAMNT_0023139447 /DNA_START=233 /DNA_END=485 /DNA_ORIENTATION=+
MTTPEDSAAGRPRPAQDQPAASEGGPSQDHAHVIDEVAAGNEQVLESAPERIDQVVAPSNTQKKKIPDLLAGPPSSSNDETLPAT